MRVNGEWYLCDDGVTRPVLRGQVLSGGGSWRPTFFLVDTGADRTVLSASDLAALDLQANSGGSWLSGVGGRAFTVTVDAQLRFPEVMRRDVHFKGKFPAFTELGALDMSVLGRDITDIFALIVDRLGDAVCLLRPRHVYAVWAR